MPSHTTPRMLFRRTKKIIIIISSVFLFIPVFWNSYALADWWDTLTDVACMGGGACAGLKNTAEEAVKIAIKEGCKKCQQQNQRCEVGVKVDTLGFSLPNLNITCKPFLADQLQLELSELEAELSARKPIPRVSIPGLNFSNVMSSTEKTGTYFYIPWIPELISALYKFGIAAVSIIAVVVIILQGVRVVTSAGGEAKQSAYKKILQSVIGLAIAWGSFAILYNVNPNLVKFNALRVKVVEREELDATLGTTNVATGEESGNPEPGSHPQTTIPCPFTLVETSGDKGRAEFYQKIQASGVVTATTPREKTVQIADIADACNINLGSCGRTAGAIVALAGTNPKNCLNPASGDCNGSYKRQIRAISKDQRNYTVGWNCAVNKDYPGKARSNCVNTSKEATKIVRDYLKTQAIPGWPDEWANQLKPGDYVVLYNGNADLVGSHAVIFMGWASEGKMQVVQGGGGGKGVEASKARAGTWCVKSSCGENMVPLLYIRTPD